MEKEMKMDDFRIIVYVWPKDPDMFILFKIQKLVDNVWEPITISTDLNLFSFIVSRFKLDILSVPVEDLFSCF